MSIRLDRQSTTVPKMSKRRTRGGLINDQYPNVAGHCFSRRAWRCCGGNHSRGGRDDRSACDCLSRNHRRSPGRARTRRDRARAGHDHRDGQRRPRGVSRADLSRARRGGRVRGRADHRADSDTDADHRQRLPPAEPVEGAVRRLVRVGGPVHQPLPGLHDGLADDHRTLVGVVSGVVVLAPSVLAVFGSTSTSTWPNILISTAILLIMVVIAIVGIRITARIQVGLGLIEYVILVGFAITGLVLVLSHHHGTFPIPKGGFTVSGIGGKGSLPAGVLIAVFMYTGWDASVYVNEETRGRSVNPGRAAVL